jgi:hypothetical protein
MLEVRSMYYYLGDLRGNAQSKEYVFMNQQEAKALGVSLYSEPSTKVDLERIKEFKANGYNVVLVCWSNANTMGIMSLLEDKEAVKCLSGFINIRGRIHSKIPRWGLFEANHNLVGIYSFNRKDSLGWTYGNELRFKYTLKNRFLSDRVHILHDNIPHTGKAPYRQIVALMEREIKHKLPPKVFK